MAYTLYKKALFSLVTELSHLILTKKQPKHSYIKGCLEESNVAIDK